MKKVITFSLVCIITSVLAILLLYAFMPRANDKKAGFTRKTPISLKIDTETNILYAGYYFAGYTNNSIYLGNYNSSLHLLSINKNLTDTVSINFKLKDTVSGRWSYARLSVDSPNIYLAEGITPRFLIAKLSNPVFVNFLPRSSYFTASVNISPSSYIAKTTINEENVLVKIQADSPYVKRVNNILKKQVDGMFCTDGILVHDCINNKIAYVYYYRNEYIQLDTNLNIIASANTVDTNFTAKIKIAKLQARRSKMQAAPSFVVNYTAAIQGNDLYINSYVRSDNETSDNFSNHITIDVYNLTERKYVRSLYLEKPANKKMTEFKVLDNKIYAIFSNQLATYNLPEI